MKVNSLNRLKLILTLVTMCAGFHSLLAQADEVTLIIENRENFLRENQVSGDLVPSEIVLTLQSMSSAYPLNDSVANSYSFDLVDVNTRKGKLELSGIGPGGKKSIYIMDLEKEKGVLKVRGRRYKFNEAFGVWECTNHTPLHRCGPGASGVKKCTDKHECIF